MNPEHWNALGQTQFVDAVGWVFEHSPWVAERAWHKRPFASLDQLSECLNQVVLAAPHAEQLALLRAHPDLGTRAKISPGSEREQAGAGLDRLTPGEYETLHGLNATYKEKFGFPFLYAVKGATKSEILDALRARLHSHPFEEFSVALQQVFRIARFRLEEIVK